MNRRHWGKAMLISRLITLTFITSIAIQGFAQARTPTPDKRGLGIDPNTTPGTQSGQTNAKEAKPELVLQTGYSNFFGATRLVFSPDGRLLATATFRSNTIKLWETAS